MKFSITLNDDIIFIWSMQKNLEKIKRKTFKATLRATIPIFIEFLFIGLVYGVYMNSHGFNYIYCGLLSAIVYTRVLQFVGVEFLVSAFNTMYVLL